MSQESLWLWIATFKFTWSIRVVWITLFSISIQKASHLHVQNVPLHEVLAKERTGVRVAVYHSHRETTFSTTCANGKQECPVVSFIQIGDFPFNHQSPINWLKSLWWIQTDHNFLDNSEELQMESTFCIQVFQLEIVDYLSRCSIVVWSKLSQSVKPKFCHHLHADQNLQNFCMNVKQPVCPVLSKGRISDTSYNSTISYQLPVILN